MVDGTLKPYRHYREYTPAEIKSEQDEYFDNDSTLKAAPGLFNDRDDITFWIKDAKLELLDMSELKSLKNSDVPMVLTKSNLREKLAASIELLKYYGKDYMSLIDAFKNSYKLPPPLVIRDKNNSLYLMAGNSRMMLAACFGYNLPVKVVSYSKQLKTEGTDLNKLKMIDIAKQLIGMHKLKTKVRFDKSNNKADYDWQKDIMSIDPNVKSLRDFIESVLHEIDHAMMRKKMGANGYEEAYTRAGQIMVDKGKDFYWDNPFEKQAEKYAEKNFKKYIKKLRLH